MRYSVVGSFIEADTLSELIDILMDIGSRKTVVPSKVVVLDHEECTVLTLHMGGIL